MTRLMDKGLKMRSRGMPVNGDLALEVDDAARRVMVLNSIEKSAIPVMGRLVHPQFTDIAAREFVVHGFEFDKLTGQLFGQAWRIEPLRR